MQAMESMAANDETLGQEEGLNMTGSQHLARPENQQRTGSRTNSVVRQLATSGAGYQTFSHPVEAENQEVPDTSDQQTGTSNNASQQNGSPNRKPRAPLNREKSFYTPYMEDRLCRKLKFFFMGPHEKIKAKRKCPWKLLIQIMKIVLVTAQLIQFGYSRSSFVDFAEKSTIAMKHLYLKEWSNAYETMPYPAAIGKYAVYEVQNLIDHINYAACKYEQTEDGAIGSMRFYRNNQTIVPLKMCLQQYKNVDIFDGNNTYNINSNIIKHCYDLHKTNKTGVTCTDSYDVVKLMKDDHNITMDSKYIDKILLVELKFNLKSFRLEMSERTFPPQLFRVETVISFDDKNKDGQMGVTLDATFRELDIEGQSINDDLQDRERAGLVVFDSVVLIFTVLSTVLCSRSLMRAQKLRKEVNHYFKMRKGRSLSLSDQCEFLNLWYVTIIINDILTVIGTAFKIQLELRNMRSSSANFDYCGLMLGTGSLLAWLGVLRYIGFFQQFNILIVTLKKAFPNMMRFLVCCILLYIGFVICGWVVLGPYHVKFRHLSTASECLFSLINGDDMFVTFSATVTKNEMVWYYSQIYLYIFISLFIYAVLNLFIAVILDTYETIKQYYAEDGHIYPKSELFEFIAQCQDPVHSSIYRGEDDGCNLLSLCCCCCRDNPDRPGEYTSLVQ